MIWPNVIIGNLKPYEELIKTKNVEISKFEPNVLVYLRKCGKFGDEYVRYLYDLDKYNNHCKKMEKFYLEFPAYISTTTRRKNPGANNVVRLPEYTVFCDLSLSKKEPLAKLPADMILPSKQYFETVLLV